MIDLNTVIDQSKDLTLLYVEDDKDTREITQLILETFFNHIIVAIDGEDGYQKYKENDIDIVITDISMPKLNGLELCKKIRNDNIDISLIILTAHNEENFFMESIKVKIDGYLLKPIDFEELSELIYTVTRKNKFLYESKKSMHLLKEYQEATNLACIVSKADTKGVITYVNDTFCNISGYQKDELIGKNHNIIRHPDNPKTIFKQIWNRIKKEKSPWVGIVRNMSKSGKSYYADSLIKPILDMDGNITEYISLRHDVTEIMNPTKQLNDAIKNATNPILVYIKLESFDMIEDFFSNEDIENIEDKFCTLLETKMSNYYKLDKVYPLKNGEFALLVEYQNTIEKLIVHLQRVQNSFSNEKIDINNFSLDTPIMISLVYEGENILESAKIGIKKILKERKRFIVSNGLADAEFEIAKNNLKTVSIIKKALDDSKITSYFQPIIDNKTQKIVKYESLIRLIDDNNKVLTPFLFLDIAKKTTYYGKIVDLILENSFSMLEKCNVDISINLSTIDIDQQDIRKKITTLLKQSGKDSSRIVFELLEDESIKNINNLKEFISMIKKFGAKIAIDDFGSGYSNYQRLVNFQPDILKIDGSLIKNIASSSYSYSIVKSIVTFAKEQGMQTIAEFVENEEIYNIVKNLEIDFSQGYHFGKPEKFI